MHRSIVALIAAGLLLLAMAMPATADEVTGPACRDIAVSVSYTTMDGTPTAAFLFETEHTDPSGTCRGVRYSGFVLNAAGTALLGEGSTVGDGTNALGLLVPVPSGPTEVCVYATSSSGPRVWDRAPDGTACVLLQLDPPSGGAQRAT